MTMEEYYAYLQQLPQQWKDKQQEVRSKPKRIRLVKKQFSNPKR